MNDLPKYIYLFYIVGGLKNADFYEWLCEDNISISPDEKILSDIINSDVENIFFYAYTTSKKIANDFISERNPKKIQGIKKSIDLYFSDYSEFEKFERNFFNCKIVRDTFITRNYSKRKDNPVIEIPMCITKFEKNFIDISFEEMDDRYYNAFLEISNIDIIFGCLTNKIKNNLLNIGFIDFIKYIKLLYTTVTDDLPSIYLDDFKIFLDYFEELFI